MLIEVQHLKSAELVGDLLDLLLLARLFGLDAGSIPTDVVRHCELGNVNDME